MNATEGKLVQALISGPIQAREVPLPQSTRKKWGKLLEERGLVERKQGVYRLTKDGYRYALKEGVEINLQQPEEVEDLSTIGYIAHPEEVHPEPRRSWVRGIARWVTIWIGGGIVIAALEMLTMRYLLHWFS